MLESSIWVLLTWTLSGQGSTRNIHYLPCRESELSFAAAPIRKKRAARRALGVFNSSAIMIRRISPVACVWANYLEDCISHTETSSNFILSDSSCSSMLLLWLFHALSLLFEEALAKTGWYNRWRLSLPRVTSCSVWFLQDLQPFTLGRFLYPPSPDKHTPDLPPQPKQPMLPADQKFSAALLSGSPVC